MNHWQGKGGLVRDPEMTYGESGVAFWRASIAVNGTRYDSQTRGQIVKTTFVSLVAFGWLAEQFAEYTLAKGDEILVTGELDNREIEKEGGVKERKTRIEVQTLNIVRRSQRAARSAADPWANVPPADQPPAPTW